MLSSRVALWCVLAVTPRCLAGAQPTSASRAPGPSRWSIAAYIGSTSSGTAQDLEAAMRSAGYTQDFGGCTPFFGCVPTSPSPASYSHANPALWAVRYAITQYVGAELLWGGSASGTTSGRSSPEIIDVAYGGTLIASLASVGTTKARVGVGPAWLRSHWDYRNTSDGSVDRVTTTSIGLVVSGTARKQLFSRLFAEGSAQYRGFPSPAVRPRQSGRPQGSARVSHTYLGLGVGVALP